MSIEADQRRQIKLQAEELEGLLASLEIEKIVNKMLREDVRKLEEMKDGMDSKD